MRDLEPGKVSIGVVSYATFVRRAGRSCFVILAPFHRCLGIENKKGSLRAGADADLVVLDRRGKVLSTWVKGKKVWERN